MALAPITLENVAAEIDQRAAALEATKATFPVGTPQSEIDAHYATLRQHAATYRRAAETIRLQLECES